MKIKAARRDVSQLSELEKGKTTKVPKKYRKLSVTEALETAKQRLTALAARLKSYTRELEAWRINTMFTAEPSRVYSQWEGTKMRADPARGETELYFEGKWEKEASHNTHAQDLIEHPSHLPEQDQVNIMVADIQERVYKR